MTINENNKENLNDYLKKIKFNTTIDEISNILELIAK